MAINFLNSIDLNKNELIKARIQNAANNEEAGAGVDGQLYFNTEEFQLKAWAEGEWGNVGGGVTSVGSTVAGGALNVSGSPITSTGTLEFTWNGDANQYVDGAGGLATLPASLNGITEGVLIDVDSSTDPLAPTVSHKDVTREDESTSQSPGYGSAFNVISSIFTSNQGHVTKVITKEITLPDSDDTTYALTNTAQSNPFLELTPSTGQVQKIKFAGTTGQINVGASTSGQINFSLPNTVSTKRLVLSSSSVNAVSLEVKGGVTINPSSIHPASLAVAGTGSFTGEVTVPNATASTSAVNFGQLQSAISGTGGFKGSYNADTNTPPLEGPNNVDLTTGDYYAVNEAGTFFSLPVVAGDFIYANDVIPANDDPDFADYTVVQSATVIATADTEDAATKGIAGFDSENFDVTAGGWVTLKGLSNPYGRSVSLDGALTYISRDASGGATEYTVDTADEAVFGLGAVAKRIKAEIVEEATGETVYAVVTRAASGANMVFEFIGSINDGDYTVLLTYV